MFQKGSFHHFWRAHTANRQSGPHDDIIKQINARVARKQTEAEPFKHCPTSDRTRCLRLRNEKKSNSYAMM